MTVVGALNTLTQTHTAYTLINAAAKKLSAEATEEEIEELIKHTIFSKADLTQEQLTAAAKAIKAAITNG
jgi:NAD(P)H-dependent FMN reductase